MGDHTTFMTDEDGNVVKHQNWKYNPKNPNKFDPGNRFDLKGEPHYNKKTKEYIETPHVRGKDIPGGVRPATPDDLPKKPDVIQ